MRSESIRFWSEGSLLAGIWRAPAEGAGPWPAIVQGPGWFGSKDAAIYTAYHQRLTARGYAVMVIDYRGFGDSESGDGAFSLDDQLTDLMNAVTYLISRPDVDHDRIGVFGTGATGGGNVIMLAASDPRVRAGVAQFPISDGRRWLREMRSAEDWLAFEKRLARDRAERVIGGKGDLVDPHRDIMVAPRERDERQFKREIRHVTPGGVSLAVADVLMRYRPIDVAPRVTTPTLLVAVENDEATPESHALELHAALGGSRRLLVHEGTTHYASYQDRADVLIDGMSAWFSEHLRREGSL